MNGRPYDDDTIPGDGATDPRLDAALDAIRRTTVPEEALRRVASAARALPTGTVATAPHRPARSGDRRPSRVRRVIALAAGLGALVILATLVPPLVARQRATAAFAEVVERAKESTSVRFTTTQRLGPGPVLKATQRVAGKRARFEMIDGPLVIVFDLERGEQLLLDTANKLAEPSHTKELSVGVGDPVEQLARVAEQGVEPVPGEPDTFRGKDVSAMGQSRIPDMLVVVDPQSRLPTRIVISDPDPKHPFEVTLDDFHWNEPVDDAIFSIDPPEGYELRRGLVSLGIALPAAPLPPVVNGRVIQDRVPAAIFWNADGTRLTTLVRDPEKTDPRSFKPNQLRQWDLATGQLRWSEEVGGAGQAAMTADGRHLAVVVGYEVQLRDADSGAIQRTWTTKERLGPLAFSPDGTTLAAGITEWGPYGGRGGAVAGGIEWRDVAEGTLRRSIGLDRPTTHLAWSPDGRWIAASANEGPVRLVDAANGEVGRELPGRGPLAFSRDGAWLACVVDGDPARPEIGRVSRWPLAAEAGTDPRSLETAAGRSPSSLLDVAFAGPDVVLVAADWNGDVTVWELESGRVVATLRDHGDGFLGSDESRGVHVVAPSPDGQSLATGGEDATVRLWSPGASGAVRKVED